MIVEWQAALREALALPEAQGPMGAAFQGGGQGAQQACVAHEKNDGADRPRALAKVRLKTQDSGLRSAARRSVLSLES